MSYAHVRIQLSLVFLQNTDQETKRLMARLESTEQRQQQMMAFLAKAVQNPAFLQELLNQRQAQRISGPDKSEPQVCDAASCMQTCSIQGCSTACVGRHIICIHCLSPFDHVADQFLPAMVLGAGRQ